MELVLVGVVLVAIVAASFWGWASGKTDAATKVLDNVSKHKDTVDTVDSMSPSDKRKQLRKYTRK